MPYQVIKFSLYTNITYSHSPINEEPKSGHFPSPHPNHNLRPSNLEIFTSTFDLETNVTNGN